MHTYDIEVNDEDMIWIKDLFITEWNPCFSLIVTNSCFCVSSFFSGMYIFPKYDDQIRLLTSSLIFHHVLEDLSLAVFYFQLPAGGWSKLILTKAAILGNVDEYFKDRFCKHV